MASLRLDSIPTVRVERTTIPALLLGLNPDLLGLDRGAPPYYIWESKVGLDIGGVRFFDTVFDLAPMVGSNYSMDTNLGVNVRTFLHLSLLDAVESRRSDDVSMVLNIELIAAPTGGQPERWLLNKGWTVSEKSWVKILSDAGYQTSWTLRVERPEIVGWDDAAKHLRAAHEKLLSRDAGGTLVDCRAALRSVEPLLTGAWPEIAAAIDLGSTVAEGYPPKSARVSSIRDAVLLMADTGGHRENYNPLIDDAEFVYGLSSYVLAYLSRKHSYAEREKRKS